MPDILSLLGPSMDPGVRLGGITTPYRAHRFGNVHIPSSTPFVEDFYSLCSVFTLVVTLTGMVVDTWMLGLHFTFLFMSHRSPHCFLWEHLSWSFIPISYSLDSLLIILGCFGLIWLSCRVQFLYTLSLTGIMSELAYRLGFHIHLHLCISLWPFHLNLRYEPIPWYHEH